MSRARIDAYIKLLIVVSIPFRGGVTILENSRFLKAYKYRQRFKQ